MFNYHEVHVPAYFTIQFLWFI